ncbi:PdaC/SigV domain-containing protein [Bizionia sp. KMM 8389]
MKKLLFVLALISIVTACEEDAEKRQFSETTLTTEHNKIVEINIPVAKGNDLVSQNINNAISSSIISSLSTNIEGETQAKTVSESINKFNSDFANFKNDFPESHLVWDAQIDGEIMYESDAIISIAITSYLNTGGAHGSLNISFINLDALTGQLIKNSQLLNNIDAFKAIAKTHFDTTIAENRSAYFDPNNFVLSQNIGFNNEGLILLYNSYEVAPYATGLTEFTIPYQEVLPYLNYK